MYSVPLSNTQLSSTKHPLLVHPNPTNSVVEVSNIIGNTVNLLSISGVLLQQQLVLNNKAHFDMSDLAPGLYFVKSVNAVAKVVRE